METYTSISSLICDTQICWSCVNNCRGKTSYVRVMLGVVKLGMKVVRRRNGSVRIRHELVLEDMFTHARARK